MHSTWVITTSKKYGSEKWLFVKTYLTKFVFPNRPFLYFHGCFVWPHHPTIPRSQKKKLLSWFSTSSKTSSLSNSNFHPLKKVHDFFSAKRQRDLAGLRRHHSCHGFDHQRALQPGRHSPAIWVNGEGDGTFPDQKSKKELLSVYWKFKDTRENHLRFWCSNSWLCLWFCSRKKNYY